MKSQFITRLKVEDDNGFPFTLIQPLTYVSEELGRPDAGFTISVPDGFKTDFASIPKVLWNILPPVGSYDKAAVVHDFLYQRAPDVPSPDGDFNPSGPCSRRQADAVLLEAMRVCGTSRAVRAAIYLGVRVGGWFVWRRYRAKDAR